METRRSTDGLEATDLGDLSTERVACKGEGEPVSDLAAASLLALLARGVAYAGLLLGVSARADLIQVQKNATIRR